MQIVVGIDVGIIHLGIVWASLTEEGEFCKFEGCDLIDLTAIERTLHQRQLQHNEKCKFMHTKTLVDRLRHFQEYYKDVLNKSKWIFIERQPIMGQTAIEQLLFDWYRPQAILVHPCTM